MDTNNQGDLNKFLENVERDLLLDIILNMRNRKITVGEAEKLARDFLALLPASDKHDLLGKLKSLSGKYQEARDVYLKYATEEHETEKNQALDTIAGHIKSGDIEKALEVAKSTTQKASVIEGGIK